MKRYTAPVFALSFPPVFAVTLAIVLGLCMGSFSSVILTRTEPHASLGGRSRCPHCRKTLGVLELIPLISYLAQRGACRGCGTRIALRYPLLELFGACAFFIAWIFSDSFTESVALGLVFWAMGVIVISDLSLQLISDLLTALLAIGAIVLHWDALVPALLAGVIGGAFLGAQWLLSRGRWVGSGDVFLITALGLFVGRWELLLLALAIAYIIGAIFAAAILIRQGSAARRLHIPFGPFLIGGALVAYAAGERIISAMM